MRRNRLPWQLMAFLADAHQRGVLRQAGAVYQFRHIELQHRLANTSGKIGSSYDVHDINGDKYRVILVKVIDPAQGTDQNIIPDNGKRFVAAVFTISAGGSLRGEDPTETPRLSAPMGESTQRTSTTLPGTPTSRMAGST